MSKISTHVLDTAAGKPAAGVPVRLEHLREDAWQTVVQTTTDADGRCNPLAERTEKGSYRLVFLTATYFRERGRTSLYPEIAVTFVCDGEAHYHLPILLSDNGYTTYRGS